MTERVQKGLAKGARFLITEECFVVMPDKTSGYVVAVTP
jgi:hypothetical protein